MVNNLLTKTILRVSTNPVLLQTYFMNYVYYAKANYIRDIASIILKFDDYWFVNCCGFILPINEGNTWLSR